MGEQIVVRGGISLDQAIGRRGRFDTPSIFKLGYTHSLDRQCQYQPSKSKNPTTDLALQSPPFLLLEEDSRIVACGRIEITFSEMRW